MESKHTCTVFISLFHPQRLCSKRLWLRHPETTCCADQGLRALWSQGFVPTLKLEVGSRAGLSAGDALDAVPMATEAASTGLAPTVVNTTKADSHVPVFDNVSKNYLEYRRRCEVYKQKMEMAGRGKETIFNPVILMTGRSWDLVEDLDVEQLANDGYKKVFERLDKGFQFDPLTELPGDFERFFISLNRRAGQTLQDYIQEFTHAERRLRTIHKVDLPEKVKAWFFLRRSGLSCEQRLMVLSSRRCWTSTMSRRPWTLWSGRTRSWKALAGAERTPWCWGDVLLRGGLRPDMAGLWCLLLRGVRRHASEWHGVWDLRRWWVWQRAGKLRRSTFQAEPGEDEPRILPCGCSGGSQQHEEWVQQGQIQGQRQVEEQGEGPRLISTAEGRCQGSWQSTVWRSSDLCRVRCCWTSSQKVPYSQGDQKRKIEDGDDAIHMVEETSIEDDEMIIMSDVAVQDGGAASFLGSYAKIREYIFYLMDKGLPDQQDRSLCMQEGLQVWQFREGGGHYTCLMLPMFAGHKRWHVLSWRCLGVYL